MTPNEFIDLIAITTKKVIKDDKTLTHPEDIAAVLLTVAEVLWPAIATMRYEWKMPV